MLSTSVSFFHPGITRQRYGRDLASLFMTRKTPKQYIEQKNRKVKRRNEDRLLRQKKQRVQEKNAPNALFTLDSVVTLSDDDLESPSHAISRKQIAGMSDAIQLPSQEIDAERIEALHKAAFISDRRHRKSFLQGCSSGIGVKAHAGAGVGANKRTKIKQGAPTVSTLSPLSSPSPSPSPSSSSSSPTPLSSSSETFVSPDTAVSSSFSSSLASKLRRKSTDTTSRAVRRSMIKSNGEKVMVKGGKSSLKDGFKAPEFKRLPDVESKARYHSSFPLRNTGA